MRIALAVLASSLLITPVAGTGLGPALGAEDATGLLTDWCIATDASAAKAESRIKSSGLPAKAIQIKQITGGVSLRLELGAAASVELELDASAGKVRSCALDARLSNPQATFAALQKQYFLGGNIDDYEPGHNTWVEIVSPGRNPLSAIVTFQISTAVSGERVGRMTAVVMPAEKPVAQ